MSKKTAQKADDMNKPAAQPQAGADGTVVPGGSASGSEQESAKKTGKTAPVFIYLAVLFAAAFLMLLLAYFIQLRNSENTIDDLRTSMTATREELMEQNQQLREENQSLQEEKDRLAEENQSLQPKIDELQSQIREIENSRQIWMDLYDQSDRKAATVYDLWRAEELFEAEEYEQSAQVFRELFAHGSSNSVAHFTQEGEPDLQRKALRLMKGLTEQGYLDVEDIDFVLIYDGAMEREDVLDSVDSGE